MRKFYDTVDEVYFNPAEFLPSFEGDRDNFIMQNLDVAKASLQHDPLEAGKHNISWDPATPIYVDVVRAGLGARRIDISPLSMGNNTLGTNDGKGYGPSAVDESRGQQYTYSPYIVKAADFYRSIAEFWADGPRSETPPGHWNTITNMVIDKLTEQGDLRWEGESAPISQLEFELQTYLALNGALHDAAVVAWGIAHSAERLPRY